MEIETIENKLEGTELFSYILSVSRHMAEERSLSPLLLYTMDEVLSLVGAERGFIVLKHEDELEFQVARDQAGNDLTDTHDAISHSILADVTQSSRSLVLGNAMTDPRFGQAYSVMLLRLRSIMCVPLITKNRTIGAIYVENSSVQGRFRDGDVGPLELLAHQAAVAIENAALNDNLEVANQHLRELDEMKNKFLFLISHELNTPLTAVKGFAEILVRQIMKTELISIPNVERIGQQLINSVNRLQETIEEILLAFRILSGQYAVTPYQGSIDFVIEDIVAKFADAYKTRNLTVSIQGFDALPEIMLDEVQLRIAFSHIMSNAIKYTPNGGKIDIMGKVTSEGVQIIFHDTGIGIPVEQQTRIFDFFHVTGTLKHHSTSKSDFQGGGLGLGLPIARGIINAFGGKIWLESEGYDEVGLPGTACYILLPLS